MKNWLSNPNNRKWIYDIAMSLGAVAVFYGLLTESELGVWLGVVAVLTNGLARTNVNN